MSFITLLFISHLFDFLFRLLRKSPSLAYTKLGAPDGDF